MKAPDFWARRGAISTMLTPVAAFYAALGKLRRRSVKPYAASIPVICVGNLTMGGAGKTPTVIDLLQRLQARGVEVHAVSRGYRGSESGPMRVEVARHTPSQVGDEPLLLAAHAPTWISRDRAAGVKAAQAAGAQAVVLDDGFQNPSVMKDLSLIVVDGPVGFGNGRVFPAGPLREPVAEGLARADAVLIIGKGTKPWRGGAFGGPVLRADMTARFSGLSLSGTRVLAFAGIGRPEKFFETVRSLGAVIVDNEAFPDHHSYGGPILDRLIERAERQNLTLVTTEKDMVKLPKSARGKVWPVPVGLTYANVDAVENLLDRICPRPR